MTDFAIPISTGWYQSPSYMHFTDTMDGFNLILSYKPMEERFSFTSIEGKENLDTRIWTSLVWPTVASSVDHPNYWMCSEPMTFDIQKMTTKITNVFTIHFHETFYLIYQTKRKMNVSASISHTDYESKNLKKAPFSFLNLIC